MCPIGTPLSLGRHLPFFVGRRAYVTSCSCRFEPALVYVHGKVCVTSTEEHHSPSYCAVFWFARGHTYAPCSFMHAKNLLHALLFSCTGG
mmetsp:Transcript_26467/g.57745  ORF Transcript_26467/g.57745 Transcript_26467/m.57745 type:complete len:90 (-) Transcript_26467:178-447(-)